MNVNNDRVADKTPKINMGHALAPCSIKDVYSKAGVPPMLQTHIPFSRLVFKLAGRKMRAYWCAEGKKPMCVVLHFISITNKKYDEYKHAKTVWSPIRLQNADRYQIGSGKIFSERIDGYDVMDIAGLKTLLQILPHVHGFAKHNAVPFRRDIDSTLTAFENGGRSMIEDLGENAVWPVDKPFSVMSAPINTTNRQAAAISTPSAMIPEIIARVWAVPNLPYGSSSKLDKIHSMMNGSGDLHVLAGPVRQKKAALQRTFPITEAGSNGGSASNALSAALAMQVRLLV